MNVKENIDAQVQSLYVNFLNTGNIEGEDMKKESLKINNSDKIISTLLFYLRY